MIQFVIEMKKKNLLGVKVEHSIMTSGRELFLQLSWLSNKLLPVHFTANGSAGF